MKTTAAKVRFLAAALMLCVSSACHPGTNPTVIMSTPDTLINRQPAVAGQFYPGTSAELQQTMKKMFAKAPEAANRAEVKAIIVPHAGYVFSGEVAAAAFNQADPSKDYKTVFIIGCSHRNSYAGAAVYSIGNYITPFGEAPVDLETARKLSQENKVMSFDPSYQQYEHSVEVQVPFVQYFLKKGVKIVPILLGTQDPSVCRKISEALKPYFTDENLFVISTDFSHYPAYDDAVKIDKNIADAICTNKPGKLIDAVSSCLKSGVENLATGCCSWPSVLTLIYMTEDEDDVTFKRVVYRNSGDSPYGEKDRVVGYWGITVNRPLQEEGFSLTDTEKRQLLGIARATINEYLKNSKIPDVSSVKLPDALLQKAGAFVTLRKHGDLRGCIGHFDADQPLYSIVQQMAVASSTQDYRFSQVQPEEMKDIEIEISVLTPMKKVSSVNQIKLGRDGIYIRKGSRGGTFLPQVATETGWGLEDFLGHCARDKAGIGWDGWKDKDTEIYTYQAYVFSE
ncbi:MAG TPA: AmmeMemoRadiSam system protein B [Bacteroidales bacterium]|jgi:AmmeMemoRadiSam system protein B/AmmeMemoRadiSam system protein A|nr:AmmeMemoRadiSam system protein B [Bacteroidales bacterium]